MSNVGFATLTIIPSAKGFAAALGGEVDGPVSASGQKAGKGFGQSFIPAMKGLIAPAAIATGALAVGGFVKGSLAAAADLEQSVGAIDAIFKGSASQMHEWAASAATAVGLTKNEFNELGSLIGAQLKNGGTAMDQLAPKTNELISLGADLSSMFGGTTREAVEALSSALKGERDPIERYGVSLNQARIDAKAAELGFQKVGSTLSQEANQAATLALIMEQTADAHGNFGREADTLAHKQQVLNALWEDGKARIGTALLPAVSALTGLLISGLGPAIDGVAGFMQFLNDAVALVRGTFTGAGADVDLGAWEGPLIDFGTFLIGFAKDAKGLVDNIVGAFEPFMPAITAAFGGVGQQLAGVLPLFSPLGLVLKALAPVLPQIAALVGQLAAQLGNVLGSALSALVPLLDMIVSALSGALVAAMPTIIEAFGAFGSLLAAVVPAIQTLLSAIAPLIEALLGALLPPLLQLIGVVLPPIASLFQLIAAAIGPVVEILVALLVPAINALLPVVSTVFGVIVEVISAAMKIVQGIIDVVTGLITGNWGQVWAGIQGIFSGVWDLIVAIVKGAINLVLSVIGAALNLIGGLWSAAWNGISSLLGGIWSGITSAISTGISNVVSFFSGLPGKILGALGDFGSLLVDTGKNLVQGLINGIKAVAGKIADAILGPVKGTIDGVKNILGIHSPSRVFMEIGRFTVEGMALGMRKSAGLIAKASDALIPVAPSFRSPDVEVGARGAAATGASGSPLIGSLTLQSSGNAREDLEETLFQLRRITRGGPHV